MMWNEHQMHFITVSKTLLLNTQANKPQTYVRDTDMKENTFQEIALNIREYYLVKSSWTDGMRGSVVLWC